MNQNEFGIKVQVGVGRDLRIPQFRSLQLCREHADVVLQMYEDGFSVNETVSLIIKQLDDVSFDSAQPRLHAAL